MVEDLLHLRAFTEGPHKRVHVLVVFALCRREVIRDLNRVPTPVEELAEFIFADGAPQRAWSSAARAE